MSKLLLAVIFVAQSAVAEGSNGRILVEKMPGQVHILHSTSLEAVLIDNQVYDPLIRIASSGEIDPVLIRSWNYDSASKTFTFFLKTDIKFSNGTPLTSQVVAQSLNRLIQTNRVQNLSRIKGAEAVLSKKTNAASGIKIFGDDKFSIQLAVEYPRFLVELADPYSAIFLEVPGEALPLGTGAYKFAEVSSDRHEVTLTRNQFAPARPHTFDRVLFTIDGEHGADVSFVDPPAASAGNMSVEHYLDTEVIYLGFNSAHPVLANKNTRASLAELLTPEMVNSAIGPVNYKIGGYIPFGVAGHDPTLRNPKPSKPSLPAKIVIANYLPKLKGLVERYCKALRDQGVACTVKSESDEAIMEEKAAGTLQAFFLRQKSTTFAVDYLLSCFTSKSVDNLYLPRTDVHFDRLLDRLLATPASNPSRILEFDRQVDRDIMDRVLIKPIRYGANKAVWYKKNLKFPALNTLGPFGLKIQDITEEI